MRNYCSACNRGVILFRDREPVKGCNCEAPIIANLEVALFGKGGMATGQDSKTPPEGRE